MNKREMVKELTSKTFLFDDKPIDLNGFTPSGDYYVDLGRGFIVFYDGPSELDRFTKAQLDTVFDLSTNSVEDSICNVWFDTSGSLIMEELTGFSRLTLEVYKDGSTSED